MDDVQLRHRLDAVPRPGVAPRSPANILTIGAVIAVMFMGSTVVTPFYIVYRQQFGFSTITLTLIYATYVIGNLAALLLLGPLSDRIGRRRTMVPAFALAAISTLLYLTATGTAALFVARGLSGFAVGLSISAATAWLTELIGNRMRAALVTTTSNFIGLALGPLVAGPLVAYAPWKLTLSYLVFLVLLAATALATARVPETVGRPMPDWRHIVNKPRIGVPRGKRLSFVSPSLTAFASLAFIGFYAALAPSLLSESLHITNFAIQGAIVAELFIVAALANLVTHSVAARQAMLSGLGLLLPSLALLVAAETLPSLWLLLLGTFVGGIAASLCYRGSLAVVNDLAPEDRRAEMASAYFVACFVGNSIPVIGAGTVAGITGSMAQASTIFSAVIALFVLVALIMGWRRQPK